MPYAQGSVSANSSPSLRLLNTSSTWLLCTSTLLEDVDGVLQRTSVVEGPASLFGAKIVLLYPPGGGL